MIFALVICCCEDENIKQHKIRYEVRTSPEEDLLLEVSYTTPSGLEEAEITVNDVGIWSSLDHIFYTGDFVGLNLINCGGKVDCFGFIYMDDNEVKDDKEEKDYKEEKELNKNKCNQLNNSSKRIENSISPWEQQIKQNIFSVIFPTKLLCCENHKRAR